MALPNTETDLLTLDEAAELLRVSPAAVGRFLERGLISAHRVGPDAVRVRRADLDVLFDPAVVETLDPEDIPIPHPRPYVPNPADINHELLASIEPWTAEERREALLWLEEAQVAMDRMRLERGGKPLPSSWPLIREARDER